MEVKGRKAEVCCCSSVLSVLCVPSNSHLPTPISHLPSPIPHENSELETHPPAAAPHAYLGAHTTTGRTALGAQTAQPLVARPGPATNVPVAVLRPLVPESGACRHYHRELANHERQCLCD